MKNLFLLTILIFSVTSEACSDILNNSLRVLDSDEEQNLCEYFGNVLLVVNVASKCGYTPQYEGLQKLYDKYKDDGLIVIGVPSRDFFQEYSAESKVAEFCSTEFGVEFPMFATTKVTGKKAHPFYKKLITASGKEPKWNFAKYLIGRDGKVIEHYKSSVTPESEKLVSAIQAVL
ncbi:MAG: glutathione peroxidase [SAR86 cluster bacterium]|nr:glutathione peroxidase [SAR86 cluster bacterium]